MKWWFQSSRGSVVTRSTVIGIGKAVGAKHNRRSLLLEYSGTINLNKHWAESILNRMNFIKFRGSKARIPATS